MYIDRFALPDAKSEEIATKRIYYDSGMFVDDYYPFGLFPKKQLSELNLSNNITILYGCNGSGKSTALNIIAQCLELNRIAPFNSSECFSEYVRLCSYEVGYDEEGFKNRIPNGSRIITSDDIFDYMLTMRTGNENIRENQHSDMDYHDDISIKVRRGQSPKPKLAGLDDYERYRKEVMALNKNITRKQFIKRNAGTEVRLQSNGETALEYFNSNIKNDCLYCLDEPENSLSAKLQEKLAQILFEAAHYCGCQLIIATHSPFLLAIPGARIYNLDETPVNIRQWWELENMRIYARFFQKNAGKFYDIK